MKNIDLLNASYILWIDYGPEGWQPHGFPNLTLALSFERNYNKWMITKRVEWMAVEKE